MTILIAGSERGYSTRTPVYPDREEKPLNAAVPVPLDEATIARAVQMSRAEAAAGRMPESDQILASVAQRAPNHPAVLNELGVRMLDRGAPQQAQAMFARATAADPRHPALWANLASSLKALGRRTEELDALSKALELDPRHLSALLQKGAHFEDHGNRRAAAQVYQNLLACIPPGAEVAPNIKEAVAHARQLVEADRTELTAALEVPLAEIRARYGGRRGATRGSVPRDPDGRAPALLLAADVDVHAGAPGD